MLTQLTDIVFTTKHFQLFATGTVIPS